MVGSILFSPWVYARARDTMTQHRDLTEHRDQEPRFYRAGEVVGGWRRHQRPPSGRIMPRDNSVAHRYRSPEDFDREAFAMWFVVEQFFFEHLHLQHLTVGLVERLGDTSAFWAEFRPWYREHQLARPRDEWGSEEIPVVEADQVWNFRNPEDPITYDMVRQAKARKQIEVRYGVVTYGSLKLWRQQTKKKKKKRELYAA